MTIRRPRAFTLIEAIIVFVIIGILSAAAIVSYSGVLVSAHAGAATTDLQAAGSEASVYYRTHTGWPTLINMNNYADSAYGYVAANVTVNQPDQISMGYDSYSGALDLATYDTADTTCFFYALPPPGSSAVALRISSTTLTCSALTITAQSLTSSSGTSW